MNKKEPWCSKHGATLCDCPEPSLILGQRWSQEELRKHCKEAFGMTDEQIGDDEIPQGVINLTLGEVTEEDMEWAWELTPTI